MEDKMKKERKESALKRHQSYDPKAFFNNMINSHINNLKAG